MRENSHLTDLFEKYYKNNYVTDIIDTCENPDLKISEDVIAIPLSIKKYPLPEIRIIADFCDEKI